ncbi:MAG: energy-coupling factor transporter transmembrane component T [Candidatus Bathyarchaeota archaeon]|nr:energy-coupling factor transporter transmembrane component T [Candidatus Bathyarchaeota archaeon]
MLSIRMFEGFKFKQRKTPIHRLDPRPKFMIALTIFALSLIFANVMVFLLLFLAQLPLVCISRSVRRWLGSIKGGAILAAMIFVMNFLTGSTLVFSATMTLRFLVLVSAFSLFFMTTSPDDLGLALEKARVPYTLSFTFTMAVRLVPTIALEAQTIIDAQRSRGLEMERGNLIQRIRNYIPILIPLIVSAIRRSTELAEALESRAFGVTKDRESLVELRMKLSDYATVIIALAVLAIGIYVQLLITLPSLDTGIKMPALWKF